jgi:hypothetical protein
MTELFRLKRDRSRWQILSLFGLGFLIFSSASFYSAQQKLRYPQPPNLGTASTPQPHAFDQPDDLIHQRQIPNGLPSTDPTSPPPNWPTMNSAQIEQARGTLIRQGFSPMQADMILLGSTPP